MREEDKIAELNAALKRYESAFECMKEDMLTLREQRANLEMDNRGLRELLQSIFWAANNATNSIKNALGIK
jgi:regulator of replication initiation timing